MTTRRRRWATGCGGAIVVALAIAAISFVVLDQPRPVGEPSDAAEALADRVERAVGQDAWARTGAVGWTFSVTGARHLWDRSRSFARVRWSTYEVQVDLDRPSRGVAFDGATRLSGDEARRLVESGWKRWVNDSFWLSAPFKLRDPGTSRAIVRGDDGVERLLVFYESGGATPGDSYLWTLDDDGTPSAWRMWVSVLPIGGIEASWEQWVTLPTGARIATRRAVGPVTIEMRDLIGGETLADVEPGPDPFALLAEE